MDIKELLSRKKTNIDQSFEVEKIFSDRIFWISGATFTLLTAFQKSIDDPLIFFPILLAVLAVICEFISLHCSTKSYDCEIEIINRQIENSKADTTNNWTKRIDIFSTIALWCTIISLSLFMILLSFNFISHGRSTKTEASIGTSAETGAQERGTSTWSENFFGTKSGQTGS
ncbi:MAG: hypothetical protein V1936_02495 [Patescibacteria group bacterium]